MIILNTLSMEVAVEASQLPGIFHHDPADRIIVATARLYGKKMIPGLVCALLLFAYSATAGQPSPLSYRPANGYVPDAKTAIQIAVAIWSPMYGERTIQGEKPFQASLKRGIWTVTGSLPQTPGRTVLGGVAVARIAKADGRIPQVIHGK